MSLHSSSFPPKTAMASSRLLRGLGIVLSLMSMIVAITGIFFRQSVVDLIFSTFVSLFGLWVFATWLRANHPSSLHKHNSPSSHDTFLRDAEQKLIERTSLAPSVELIKPIDPFYISHSVDTQMPTDSSLPTYVPAYSAPIISSTQKVAFPEERERQVQELTVPFSYIPIDKDAIFELDRPISGERCFILPKEGEPLVECQDSYALQTEYRCYAVADGVAGSFVPGPWARIVAKSFVERAGKFADKDEFQYWLSDCSQQWHAWIENRWVPTMNALRESNGDCHGEWSSDIRQGAQTTLIGCSLLPDTKLQDGSTIINVFAIGDGEFFLFRSDGQGNWKMVEAFPYSDPDAFGSRPDTLLTMLRADLLDRSWLQRKIMQIAAFPGDYIVLASDTVAKWLLTQVQQNTDTWMPLLTSITSTEFARRMRYEARRGRIEDDDLTILVIPVA